MKSELRLFLSVDIVGSTNFKYPNRIDDKISNEREKFSVESWLSKFTSFYSDFQNTFRNKIWDEKDKNALFKHKDAKDFLLSPSVWKTLGDEIVFSVELKNYEHAYFFVFVFIETIVGYEKCLRQDAPMLGLKGAAWIAGFPVTNSIIKIPRDLPQEIISRLEEGLKGEPLLEEVLNVQDYIGPQIDIGFRLSRLSTRQKFTISVDLALLLTSFSPTKEHQMKYHYSGKQSLKGVLFGKDYPIIWIMIECGKDGDYGLFGETSTSDLQSYCEKFIKESGAPFYRPFIIDDYVFNKKPDWYDAEKERVKKLLTEQHSLDIEDDIY